MPRLLRDPILHRSAVTAADKLAAPSNVTIEDITTQGSFNANTSYYGNVAAYNRWGSTGAATAQTVKTANDGNNTHGLKLTLAQVLGADGYDVFMSTHAHPLWVARITEAQRAAGGRIAAVGGGFVGDLASDIAGKIRTALAADADVGAFFAISGTGANIILTAKTKAANDATMNVAIADDTSVGVTTAAASADTTPGVAPVCQVETATAVGTITVSGNARVTVTAAGMTNSPKTVSVAVTATDTAAVWAGKARTALGLDADVAAFFTVSGTGTSIVLTAKTAAADDGTMNIAIDNDDCQGITPAATSADTTPGVAPVQQVETATIVGTITGDGNAKITVTAAGMTNSPKDVNVAVDDGTAQVETITVLGTVTGDGDARAVVTANGMGGSPKNVDFAVDDGTAQVETATVDAASEITVAGNVDIVITSAIMAESPAHLHAYCDVGDDESVIATKIRAELNDNASVTDHYTVSGAANNIILTAKVKAANDASLNIAIADGTSTGCVTVATSADTTPGVAPDDAAAVGGKLRTALGLDADVSAFFTISGAGANAILTAKTKAANDATMNISLDNLTCTGLTTVATSADTTPGVAADNASAVAGKCRTALGLDADVGAFFTVSGAGANIVLTAKTAAADDATMNIASDNGTCTGLTPQAASANTVAGVAGTAQVETATAAGTITTAGNAKVTVTAAGMTNSPKSIGVAVALNDTAATWAGKVRTALGLDADVGGFFTVSGAGTSIVLTAKTKAADDATLNIALDNGAGLGITEAPASANTVAGVAGTAQVETATAAGAVSTSGNATVTVTAAGMTNSPKAVSVAVSATTGASAGVVELYVAGTGLADNVNPFVYNNAYTPASVTGVNCVGYTKAYVLVKMAVTDLRSLPSLVLTYFLQNQLSTSDWTYYGTQTVDLLGATKQPQEQTYAINVDGAAGLAVLIDSISGQGAAASVWVELMGPP